MVHFSRPEEYKKKVAEYVRKYASEEALRSAETSAVSSSSESSMSDYSEDEAQVNPKHHPEGVEALTGPWMKATTNLVLSGEAFRGDDDADHIQAGTSSHGDPGWVSIVITLTTHLLLGTGPACKVVFFPHLPLPLTAMSHLLSIWKASGLSVSIGTSQAVEVLHHCLIIIMDPFTVIGNDHAD